MPRTYDVIRESQGWTDATVLELALRYIAENRLVLDTDSWEAFLERNCDDRKYYRTVYTLTVLSEEPIPDTMDLADVVSATIDGDYSGSSFMVTEEITADECAKALVLQGSSPAFFDLSSHTYCARCSTNLDEDGCCCDPSCAFNDKQQDDPAGWAGHPERGANITRNT